MNNNYDFNKIIDGEAWTLEEIHKALAPDMSMEDFRKLLFKTNLIKEDGSPTQWAIDNGYIIPMSNKKELQFMELSEIFGIPYEGLYTLVEKGELRWIEEAKEWALSEQGIKDMGMLSSKEKVQEFSKKFTLRKVI